MTAPDGVKYTLTLRGDAVSLDGETLRANSTGEAVVCAVSEDGANVAMTLVRVAEKQVETEPVTEEDTTEPDTTEVTTAPEENKENKGKGWIVPVVICAVALVAAAAVTVIKKIRKK